ncbi:MAG: UDP-3-O-(3-hydroxymyristoyl)glucosamine N-acyltransferase [Pirellulaceae bacterium]|jgi:UDP-3-O-[3-hydroxymyristoyl] glucosamine N-acyltransferase|nr:UDP-3-O-(3-hydroxymyristoyl)glucosamine N-acyltransferase [Pirellulaceae bacterium]MDP7018661.1 UDP-3-O-(3-hydroxymyristoyl)glucosamine N-acyltransferase [Pirellulaceae bacterium]
MRITLQEIADRLDGRLQGDGAIEISGAKIIRDVCAGEITLADDPKYAEQLAACPAAAVLTHDQFPAVSQPHVLVDRESLHESFGAIVSWYHPPRQGVTDISPSSWVSESASIGQGVRIGPGAWIGDDVALRDNCTIHAGVKVLPGSTIGEQTVIFANSVLYENSLIGKRCLIHAGSVIGSYGFGYTSDASGHRLCPQVGWVELADGVEVGANSTIDRGTFGATCIGEGTKLDNMVHVAHNCRIGKHNLLCAQVGIAGSTTTGDFVVLAGQVGIRDHVHIGDGASVGAKSGVSCDIGAGESFFGIPANPNRRQMVMLKSMERLPVLRQTVRELTRRIEELEDRGSNAAGGGESSDSAQDSKDAA